MDYMKLFASYVAVNYLSILTGKKLDVDREADLMDAKTENAFEFFEMPFMRGIITEERDAELWFDFERMSLEMRVLEQLSPHWKLPPAEDMRGWIARARSAAAEE